jgi:methionine synthase I (cobalamin-dependent)
MGPIGKSLAKQEIDVRAVSDAFKIQAEALAEGGADALVFETFSDVEEARLAVRAARPTGLPIVVSFAFITGPCLDQTMTGADPETAAYAMLEEGADVVGANCGVGPELFPHICRRLKAASGLPIWIKPSAGLPSLEAGRAAFRMTPAAFAAHLPALIEAGASFVGGCCGTSPEFIGALAKAAGMRQSP